MDIQFILDNFEYIFDSEEKIKDFDNIILQLAVSGRLNTQDPNDEPASELLKKIQDEKEKLIKEGKMKKEKPLPPILETEIPYDLPKQWDCVRLGELGLINPRNYEEDGIEASFVPMTLIKAEYGAGHTFEKKLWKDIKSGFTHFAENDITVAKITPCFENGKSAVMKNLVNGFGAGTTELHVFRRVTEDILPEFILIHFKSAKFLKEGEQKMIGSAGQKRVPKDYICNYVLGIPSFEEQKRIVEVVEKLLSKSAEIKEYLTKKNKKLITLNQSALHHLQESKTDEEFKKNFELITDNFNDLYVNQENLKGLRQTILQLAVQGKIVPQNPKDEPACELLKKIKAEKEKLIKEGKIKKEKPLPPITEAEIPYALPQNWEWVRLNDYSDIGTGTTPTSTNPDYYNGNINWVTSTLTSYDFITSTEKNVTEKAVKDFNLKIYPPKTLVIALYGQGKTRGQISELAIPSTINQACASIRNILDDEILKSYTKLFFKKHYEEIRELAAGCAQPNLNVGKIKSTLIPIPPIEEQKRIFAKVDELMKICDELEEQIKQSKKSSEQLIQSILYNIFNSNKQNNKSNIIDIVPILEKRAILDAEIKSRLHKKKNFGAVKNEKILYLCEIHLELDLGGKYERRPAGPHDPSDRYQVEAKLLEQKWFTYNKEKYSNNEKKIWTPAENNSEVKEFFETCFAKEKSKIEEIIDIFKDKDTERCEAIATLYAVWNDFLIDKNDASDDDIVNDFRNNWDDSKKKFKISDLKDYLIWMRDKKLVPRGQGAKTIKLDGKQLQLVSKK